MYVKYRDRGLVIIGFDTSDSEDKIIELLKEKKVTFPTIFDTGEKAKKIQYELYQKSGRAAVPLNYLIDEKGKVIDAWYGYEEKFPRVMKALNERGIK